MTAPGPSSRSDLVDFDHVDPEEVAPTSIDGFVMTVAGEPSADRLAAAFATLTPSGVGRLRVTSATVSVTALVAHLPTTWRDRVWRRSRHGIELEVRMGDSAALDDEAVALAIALEIVEELSDLPAEVDALSKRLARVERESKQKVERVQDTTQFRIGAALVELVRSPRRLPQVVRELRSIWKRRSSPAARQLPDVAADPWLHVKVGSILDEFTHECLAPEVALIPLDSDVSPDQLRDLDLILVESAWRGNAGRWSYVLNRFEQHGDQLRSVLEQAERLEIPTAFWNKEDPVAFDLFLPAARAFDHVFTTDDNMVPRYRAALGSDQIATMAFAAQPALHNPVGRPRGDDVLQRLCFAGSWRGDKYDARRRDFETLLTPPLERGLLDIYDRYANGNVADQFPEPYRSAVVGQLPYRELNAAYRRYAAFLNVNSVSDSPTMFSRRVFELLACGTPVISTPALGIEELLGETALITDTQRRTDELVEWVLTEHEDRDRHAHVGYRLVHTEHTYGQRIANLLDRVGVPTPPARRRVSIICSSNRPEHLQNVIASYTSQTYEDKEMIFVANSSRFDEDAFTRLEREVPGCRILRIDESASLGQCLNEALAVAEGEYFAKFDDDDLYGPNYLADLMLAFRYSGAAVVGKQSYYAYLHGTDETVVRFPGREFCDAPRVVGGTLVVDRSQVEGLAFTEVHGPGTDSLFLEEVRAQGSSIFSADRYNFCQVRQADPSEHTWKIDDEEFLQSCRSIGSGRRDDQIFV